MLPHSGNRVPGRITRLPEHLINQIAAGEVVERPASVVKELVENSLDAGATRVDVLLREGGLEEIQIQDNGHGIAPEQMPLALERHTTSKLTQVEDLDDLATYGFRGEALSSIASVAEVTLKSRTDAAPHGTQLVVTHGVSSELQPVALPVGTSITVRRLFERLPARQKFMRTPATEFSHCARTLKEIAVGNPEVAFYLHHGGKIVHTYPVGTRRSRFLESMKTQWEPLHVVEENIDARFEAFLSPPHWLADRGELLIYVNARSVRAKTVSGLLRNIYSNTLGPHHEPCGVLYLDLRHDWVDVNVHPQKLEVRILKQENLFQWIGAVVRKRLQAEKLKTAPPVPLAFPQPTAPAAGDSAYLYRAPALSLFSDLPETSAQDRAAAPMASGPGVPLTEGAPRPAFRYLGQAGARYLICEDEAGLLVIDPRALHAALLHADFLEGLKRETASQTLLVPKLVKIPAAQRDTLEALEPLMQRLGFHWDSFGENEIAVKAVSPLIQEADIEDLIDESLKSYSETEDAAADHFEKRLAPLVRALASRSATRNVRQLAPYEAVGLLKRFEPLGLQATSPQGKPIAVRLEWDWLAKRLSQTKEEAP